MADTTLTDRPTYADQVGWRRIQGALPAHLRRGGLTIDVRDAASLPSEEWFAVGETRLHLDRYAPLGTPRGATLLLVHGGDANGRLLAPYALMAARAGYEAIAFDLPGYGLTRVPDKAGLVYEDWILVTVALLRAAAERGPVVLFGLGAGGLLAYEAAARTAVPAALVATHLLDWRRPAVLRATARVAATATLAVPALRGLQGTHQPPAGPRPLGRGHPTGGQRARSGRRDLLGPPVRSHLDARPLHPHDAAGGPRSGARGVRRLPGGARPPHRRQVARPCPPACCSSTASTVPLPS